MPKDGESYVRDETDAQRLDRNYGELLQEFRVAQAGVQILFAFLLTLPFQNRFSQLDEGHQAWYLGTLLAAATAVVLFVAPVAAHRVLFRRRRKDDLVVFAGRLAVLGLIALGVTIIAGVGLVVDLVGGRLASVLSMTAGVLMILGIWWALPARWRGRSGASLR
ncbi:hypothetical protein GIS00_15605 [Nakamurella sp. YIM 132087]|uniref:Sodium:proton antiporter n=1 Tax=Nakamurella alba TaxID=2665158 RepID=A0A7K1FRD5_9ACTN|nr:hypothetical protein [Nakamurella alba]